MMHFLQNCLQPNAVLMLFVAAFGIFGYALPRPQDRWVFIIWFFIAMLALVSWVFIVGG